MTDSNITDVDTFMDESIRLSNSKNYYPTEFMRMRERYNDTALVMAKLVISGEIQSGFKRMVSIGLIDWTVEAGILRFEDQFTTEVVDAAMWRLKEAQK